MLSSNIYAKEAFVGREEQNSAIGSLILRASSDLATCESRDIENLIMQSIAELSAIEHAEHAGWFLLSHSGTLTDIFPSTPYTSSLNPLLKDGLHRLPWCLAQLNAGKPVLIEDSDDLPHAAESDKAFLRAADVRSLMLLASNSSSVGKTVLILSSPLMQTEWSEGTLEQCTLLEHIFSNAYQRVRALNESAVGMSCFQQMFSASMTSMALLNSNGQIVLANHAMSTLLGYSEEELLKLRCTDIAVPTSQRNKTSLTECPLHPALEHHPQERTLVCKDQSLILTRVTTSLIEGSFPESPLSLVCIEDLTRQKHEETELNRRQTEVGVLASLLIQSQEDERKRLSRELHDDIGQRLSLVASEVALLASQHSTAASSSADRLEDLRSELDAWCTDIHEMSHDLHSYKLQHLGLRSALKDLCRRLTTQHFCVNLYADDLEEPNSKEVALCLYRVAQESLSNAHKHAHAPVAAVTITKLQDMFYLTIQDSGVGFESSTQSHGLGLVSMRERIKLVDGNFRIHSLTGQGTEIWVAVPDGPAVPQPLYNC